MLAAIVVFSVTGPCVGASWTEGSDGHRVAQPSRGTWTDVRHARRVVHPSAWTRTEGSDRRRVVYSADDSFD